MLATLAARQATISALERLADGNRSAALDEALGKLHARANEAALLFAERLLASCRGGLFRREHLRARNGLLELRNALLRAREKLALRSAYGYVGHLLRPGAEACGGRGLPSLPEVDDGREGRV